MIRIVTIGNDLLGLLPQSLLATLKSWLQLPIVDGIRSRRDIHYQPVRDIGYQLHIVAGYSTAFTVSHHMSLRVSTGGSGYVSVAVTALALLQTLNLT